MPLSDTILGTDHASAFDTYARALTLDNGNESTLQNLERLAMIVNRWGTAGGIAALYDAARATFDGIAPGELQNVAPERLMARLTRVAEHDRLSEEFLQPSVGGSP